MAKKLIGRYIVADPKICHGKPTFRGTRIMVWQVLRMVAKGKDWDSISDEWVSKIPREAIAEAVSLAAQVFVDYVGEYTIEAPADAKTDPPDQATEYISAAPSQSAASLG